MIAPDLETGILRLRELVDEAKTVVPFTGAGISTECGIPDFRSPGGLWTKMKPIDFGDFLASREARDESWRRRFVMEEQFGAATPGRGHLALASLYRQGKVPAVVTQNIDNLHQNSGIAAGDVVVIRYEGPVGGPGMPEMLTPTSAIMGAGLGKDVALITEHMTHDGLPPAVAALGGTAPTLRDFLASCLRREPRARATATALRGVLPNLRRELATRPWPVA